jgi:hypothetical protein
MREAESARDWSFRLSEDNLSAFFSNGDVIRFTRDEVDRPTAHCCDRLLPLVPYPQLACRVQDSFDVFRRLFDDNSAYDSVLLESWKFRLFGSEVRWLAFRQGIDKLVTRSSDKEFVFALVVSRDREVHPSVYDKLNFRASGFPGADWILVEDERLEGCLEDNPPGDWKVVRFVKGDRRCVLHVHVNGDSREITRRGFQPDLLSTGADPHQIHVVSSTLTHYSMARFEHSL